MSAIEPPLGQEQGETDRAEIEGLPAAVAGDAPKAPASAPSSTTGELAPTRGIVDRMETTRPLDPPHLGASQTPQYLARTLDANTTRKGEPPLEATPEVGEALPGLQEREIDAIGIESAATLVARGPIIPPSRPREVSLGDSAVDATRPQGGGRELPDTPQPAALRPLRSAMPEQEASGSLPGAVQHGVDQERSLPTQPSPLQDAVPTRARRIAADAPSIRHQPPSVSAWSMPLESVADETGALPGAPLGQDASAPPELPEPSRLRDIPLHEALFGPEAGEGRGLVRRAERPKPQDERADVASESLPALEVTVVRRQAETSQEPTTPAPEQGSGAASPDIEQLAEEVYRRIRERLRIERERRGESGPRWR